MTTVSPRTTRKKMTLADAARLFAKYPSPWMIGSVLVVATTARIIVGDWQLPTPSYRWRSWRSSRSSSG